MDIYLYIYIYTCYIYIYVCSNKTHTHTNTQTRAHNVMHANMLVQAKKTNVMTSLPSNRESKEGSHDGQGVVSNANIS